MNRTQALRPIKPHQIYQPPVEHDDGMSRYVGMSIAFHLLLLAVFTIRAVFYSGEPIILEHAIRVDIVGLPEKSRALPAPIQEPVKEAPKPVEQKAEPVKSEPPKPVLPTKSAAEKSDPSKINLSKTKKAQESALKRLEALQKLETEMKASKAKAAAQAQTKPQPVRGNEVSPGTALTGIAKLENDDYLSSLDQHVKQHWNLPNFLEHANLSATAVVYVDENGNVIKKVLTKSSGNEILDQSGLSSIDSSSPVPPPPARLVNLFKVDGIQLGFPE